MKTEEEAKMREKPKIIGVYKELDLIGKEIHLRAAGDDDDDDDGSVYYVVEPDPGVTETMTCTDMVCSTSEAIFKDKGRPPEKGISLQIKTVLPQSLKLADEVKVSIRKSKKI